MTPLRTLVIEDTEIARLGLVQLLTAYDAINVVGQAANIKQALALITQQQPDLLFLDIQMPGGSGFDLLAQLEHLPKIIFTTAFADYALQAFEYPTVDYLLKPISRTKLNKAIAKLAAPTKADVNTQVPSALLSLNNKLIVKDGDNNHVIKLADIRMLESCKNHTQVYFAQNKPFVHKALSHIESRLPEQDFFRINRSQIINIHHISDVFGSLGQGYEINIGLVQPCVVSRRQSILLKERLSL